MVIDLGQGSDFDKARRIREIIGAHGKEMTQDAIDRAVDLWDLLTKNGLNNQETEEVEMQKSQKDGLDQGLLERGRAFVKLGFKPRQAAQMAIDIAREIGSNQDGTVAPKSTQTPPARQPAKHLRWGAMPGVWGNDRLMVEDSAPAMPQASQPVKPYVPTKLVRDTTPYSGYQMAAIKVGLDPSTPGLESMSFDQMKNAAANIQTAAARKQAEAQGIYYGSKG